MTSRYSTTALTRYLKLNGKADTAFVRRDDGTPLEGQWPMSYATTTATEVNPVPQFQIVDRNLTASDNTLRQCVGRVLYFAVNTPSAYTLTLSGTARFNQGTTSVATFSNSLESVLELAVVTTAAGALVVKVVTFRNVTFA